MKCNVGNVSDERIVRDEEQEMKKNREENKKRYGQTRGKTTVGFERGNWSVALKNKRIRSNRYFKHTEDEVPWSVDLDHFKSYGPGIYLFFSLLKQLSFLFLVMSIVSVLPIVYNLILGTHYDNINGSVQVYVGKLSLGNMNGNIPTLSEVQNINQSSRNKLIVCIPDMVYSVVFFAFFLYWSRRSNILTKQIKSKVKMMSYYTLELIDFPKGSTEEEINRFMSKFGNIKQIAEVKNYSEMISLSTHIYDLELEMKQIRLSEVAEKIYDTKIAEKMKEIQFYKEQLKKQEETNQKAVIKYYVVFQTIEDRQKTAQLFEKLGGGWCKYTLCRQIPPQQICINGYPCKVRRCEAQPAGILWENVHITWKSRWIRLLIQVLILILVLTSCFLLILVLNGATPPLSNTSIDTSSYDANSIQRQTDETKIQSWCLKNTNTAKSQQLADRCEVYQQRYTIKILITIAISFSIIATKMIVNYMVIRLSKFQRYKSQTEQSRDIMTNLFITYVCTTVLITMFMQANMFGISFKNFLLWFLPQNSSIKTNLISIPEYNDFEAKWYLDIGYQIWLTWLFLSLSPHMFQPLYQLISEKINQHWGRKQILQKNMEKAIQSPQFQIEDSYATICMVIFVGFGLSGGMPILIPLSFVALATRYAILKYSFLRFCRIPKALDQSLNTRVTSILGLSVLFHLAISIWMYGVSDIFAKSGNWMSNFMLEKNVSFLKGIVVLLERLSSTWYMTILFGIFIVIMALKAFIFDLILKSTKIKVEDKYQDKCQVEIISERCLTDSYKLQNNPEYFPILAIMNPKTLNNIPA